MRNFRITIFFLLLTGVCFAQKPAVPDSAYKQWPELRFSKISPNGKYAIYTIYNMPVGQTTTVLTASDNSWKKEFVSAGPCEFSPDGKSAYVIRKGYLIEVKLGGDGEKQIAKTEGFRIHEVETSNYLTYNTDSPRAVVICNLISGQKLKLLVDDYIFTVGSHVILTKSKSVKQAIDTLSLVNLQSGKHKIIYRGPAVSNLIIDRTGSNVVFTTGSDTNADIWSYRSGDNHAKTVLSQSTLSVGRVISTSDVWEFSEDGEKLYFTLPKTELDNKKNEGPDIWSYQDKVIYPLHKKRGFPKFTNWRNLAMVELNTGKVTQLLFGNEQKPAYSSKRGRDKFVMKVVDSTDRLTIKEWTAKTSYFLVDEHKNVRVPLKLSTKKGIDNIQFSPDEKFITYLDYELGEYVCYEIATKKNYYFTRAIRSELNLYNDIKRKAEEAPSGINAWIKGTNKVLMTGTYGIWELDVKNQAIPRNLTEPIEPGRKVFMSFCQNIENEVVDPSMPLYVTGVDFDTKATSIYRLDLARSEFAKLYEGDFYWSSPYSGVSPLNLQKASKASTFLVRFPKVRETANVMATVDFKHFDTLSKLQPEKQYNWLTSELHTYKDSLGNLCHGILYKPENFDPGKKYPVVFSYYQEQARYVFEPVSVDPSGIGMNIPYLVSHGYLVFRPDMYNEKGKFGEYALLSINAAADHLSKFDWIDNRKMAITGHSYGGFETNYFITHTNRFVAAISGAGVSNLANNALDLWGLDKAEKRSYAMGAPMMVSEFEDDPKSYIDYSPIFNTKNVKTPVLFVHNENDLNVAFNQSSQFFISLRHLEKPAWLLAYKDGGHMVNGTQNRIDLLHKVEDFLGYYLKNQPMPDWMKHHITD